MGGRGRGIEREMNGSGRSVLYTSAKLTTENECAPVVCVRMTAWGGGGTGVAACTRVGILTTSQSNFGQSKVC